MRAASYSSRCSLSVRVSRAKSRSMRPLAEALRNSAHAALLGGRSLCRARALRGEGGWGERDDGGGVGQTHLPRPGRGREGSLVTGLGSQCGKIYTR